MTSPADRLSRLLVLTNLGAKKQDGKILLYNRQPKLISRGVAVDDVETAAKVANEYLRHLRSHGFTSLNIFVDDNLSPSIDYSEVNNKVDRLSAYYVSAAPLSSVSRINMLRAASILDTRAAAALVDTIGPELTERDRQNHRKQRKIAAALLVDPEKAV